MKAYYAFFCGSLLSALSSFGVSILYGSHVGRALSFAIIGTGGGLVVSAIGLAILFIIWCCKDKNSMPETSTDKILWRLFLPIVIVPGATWLFFSRRLLIDYEVSYRSVENLYGKTVFKK